MDINSIMVVDDNDGDRFLAQLAIEDANVTDKVFFSENGKTALDFLSNYEANKNAEGEQFPPILIFLDINIPKMNGFEFLEEYEKLMEDTRYQSIVVMMLTSSVHERDLQRSKEFSCVKSWITKPITEKKVLEVIAGAGS